MPVGTGDIPASAVQGVGSHLDRVSRGDIRNPTVQRTLSLIVGPGETMVLTVKVVRGEEEEVLTPNTKLVPGKRYVIVVEEDGKVETSVVDR